MEKNKILIIRGDLNSHSGYTKAILNYLHFNFEKKYDFIFGIDIHYNVARYSKMWEYPLINDNDIVKFATENNMITLFQITTPDNYIFPNFSVENNGLFFWETDRINNSSWIKKINKLSNFFVPINFMKNMLLNEGVNIPINYMPYKLGLTKKNNINEFNNPIILKEVIVGSENIKTVTLKNIRSRYKNIFLSINTYIPRKGNIILFSEWKKIINKYEDVALILKTSSIDITETPESLYKKVLKDINNIFLDVKDLKSCHIYLLTNSIEESDINTLHYQSDFFVTLTYGEGLGLGVLKMLEFGKIVILPRHTSFVDLLPNDYPFFLDTDIDNYGLPDPIGLISISSKWGVPKEGSFFSMAEKVIFYSKDELSNIVDDTINKINKESL